MLRPLGELLGFEKNKIRKQKIKFSYSPQINKKFKHKKDCQNLVKQSHEPSIETNLKKIQGRIPCIQTTEYSQHTRRKNNSSNFYVKQYDIKKKI